MKKRHPLATATLTLSYQDDNVDYLATFFYGCPQATIGDVAWPLEWAADEEHYYRRQLALQLGPRLVDVLRG